MTGKNKLRDLIKIWLEEDLGDGDHTSLATIPADSRGKAKLLVKEEGVLAGVSVAREVFHIVDSEIEFILLLGDGTKVKPGDIAFTVSGRSRSILSAERLVLNIMQRMSGIATSANTYSRELDGLKTKILDTRKTGPGMRLLEKEAVRIGGGENHRMGLYDMIMIKDNHIDFAGGIANAIRRTVEYLDRSGKKLRIEIEARNLQDVIEIMKIGGVDRIMLDNFSPADTREAVEIIGGKYETESSGGITLANIREYAGCGVDYISVGALTHHVKSLDLSLKAIKD
ncbi:MAG: carboxylating nicotinate-nucleotide diphosphorylase [Bacteroidales bacterium]